MNKSKNMRIAIVGGGPGGLTLARLLQMNGFDVRVYERDRSRAARVQGATLNINEESGLRALHQAGLMEQFWTRYRAGADKLILTDQNATTLLEEFTSEDVGRQRPEIDRGPLWDLLLDSFKPDTVVWGCQCMSLTHQDDSVQMHLRRLLC